MLAVANVAPSACGSVSFVQPKDAQSKISARNTKQIFFIRDPPVNSDILPQVYYRSCRLSNTCLLHTIGSLWSDQGEILPCRRSAVLY